MARAVNKTVVGIVTLAIVVVLSAGAFVVVENLPGQDPKRYEADARRFEGEKKWAEARQMFARAYQRDPAKNPRYLVSAARCALETGDIEMVIKFVQMVRLKDSRNKEAAEIITQLRFEIAGVANASRQWALVREEASRLQEIDPKSVLAHHALGAALVNLANENPKNLEDGAKELRAALSLDPTNVEVVKLLVKLDTDRIRDLESRRQKAAVAEIRDAINAMISAQLSACQDAGDQRKVAELLTLRASTLIQMGDRKKGIEELEKFTAEWPNESLGFRTLGTAYAFDEKPDLKKAEELMRKAVELRPTEGENYLLLGRLLSVQPERVAEENAIYEQGLAAIPFSKHYRNYKQNFFRGQMMYLACLNDVRVGARSEADPEKRKQAFASAEKWIGRLTDEQGPDQISVLLLKAQLLNAKGDLKEATNIALRADRLASSVYEVKELLGELLFRQEQWGEARKQLEAALAMDPRQLVPRLQLGHTYLKTDQPALTLKVLMPTEAGPLRDALMNSQHATTLVMEAYRAQGMYELAEAANKRLQGMTGDVTGSKLREAQLALAAEKFQDAERLLDTFIKADKVEPDAARLYVYLLEMTERREDAIKFIDEQVKKSPDEVAFLELQTMLNRTGNEPVSDDKILEIINKEKDPFRREMNAFQFWASRTNFEKAQVHLNEAEKLKPDDSTVVERQLLMALNAKDWERAGRYVERNRELNLDGTQGRIAKGRVASARGMVLRDEAAKLKDARKDAEAEAKSKEAAEQFRLAIEQIKAGLDAYPNYSIGWTNLAEAYLGADRIDDCRNALQRALDLDPTNGLANRAMVQLKLSDGDEAAANEYLAKAVKALPNDPYLRQRLEAVEEKKKPVEGIKKREAILAREPKNLQNLVRLAQLYRVAEKFDRAAESYEAALALAKEDKKAPYIQLLREAAYFYADPQVNRPADGESLLEAALRESESPSDKAQLAIFLSRFYESQQHISTAERHILMAVNFDTSTSVLISAAEYFSRNNKLRDAIEYYERAAKTGAVDERMIHARLFSLSMALRDYDRAKAEIDSYLVKYPNDQDGKVLLATYHMMGGDIAEAEKALSEELEQRPDNAVALWQRGQLNMLKNKWPQAHADLAKAKTSRPDGFDYQHRVALAETLVEMGRYDEAITELKTILDKSPDSLAVASALADVYFRVKPSRFADADRLVRTYMAQYNRDERWALLLGRLGSLKRDANQEIEGYAKAAEISEYRLSVVQALFDALRRARRPEIIVEIARTNLASRRLDQSPTVLAALGWAYTEMKDREKAFATYDAALAAVGGDFSYHALILMEMCDYYGVDEIYQRAKAQLAEQPDSIIRQKTMLFLLWRNRETEEAIRLSRNIVENAKDDRDRIFARMALAAFQAHGKQFEDAKAQYEEILKIDPSEMVALNNLACLLVDDLNKPEEALPYAERAAKVGANDSNILDTLGWTLARCKQYGKATTFLLRALEANSENAAALYHLAKVHLERQEADDARRRLLKAREVESQRVESMRRAVDDLVAQMTSRGVNNGRVLREADSDILPKIEEELAKLK